MNKYNLPTYLDITKIVYEIIKEKKEIERGDLIHQTFAKSVKDFKISDENANQKYENKQVNILENRILWAISYLKNFHFIKKDLNERKNISFSISERNDYSIEKLKNEISEAAKEYRENNKSSVENIQDKSDYTEKENDESDTMSSPWDKIEFYNKKVEETIKEQMEYELKNIDPFDFEIMMIDVLVEYLKKQGILTSKIEYTQKTKDKGIDGILKTGPFGINEFYIQTKRYDQNPITPKMIREFVGVVSTAQKVKNINSGIYITTSSLTKEAKKVAKDANLIVFDLKKLVEIMYENNIGVQDSFTVKEVNEEFFQNYKKNSENFH